MISYSTRPFLPPMIVSGKLATYNRLSPFERTKGIGIQALEYTHSRRNAFTFPSNGSNNARFKLPDMETTIWAEAVGIRTHAQTTNTIALNDLRGHATMRAMSYRRSYNAVLRSVKKTYHLCL